MGDDKKYYCPEHKYNPPANSGWAFCPRCEIESTPGVRISEITEGNGEKFRILCPHCANGPLWPTCPDCGQRMARCTSDTGPFRTGWLCGCLPLLDTIDGDDIDMTIRKWTLTARKFDGTEIDLNPHNPFYGDVFDAGDEADALAWEIDNVESLIVQSGPLVASIRPRNRPAEEL